MNRALPVLALALLIPLALLVAGQPTIIPSKEDRILEKLDRVLADQKEIRAALDRLEKSLKKDGEKGEKPGRGAGGARS